MDEIKTIREKVSARVGELKEKDLRALWQYLTISNDTYEHKQSSPEQTTSRKIQKNLSSDIKGYNTPLVKPSITTIPQGERWKDQPEFQEYVKQNQWADRRKHPERPWPWNANVFEFIAEVYKPYLGNGLVQSDFRELDKKLYAQFHKCLAAIKDPVKKQRIVDELPLHKERSDEGFAQTSTENSPEKIKKRAYNRKRKRTSRKRVAAINFTTNALNNP
ncbi:MAG: hypothetical protein HRT94_03840 [Alphaproteobacteria bacterium]|nr:hypothetical protein [Alphaproteobacteria bacterium]